MLDHNKFSFAQASSNDNGKSSGSKTTGLYWAVVVPICFCYGCYKNNSLIINATLQFASIVTALLIGSKLIKPNPINETPLPASSDSGSNAAE